jgi:hypothetical protein
VPILGLALTAITVPLGRHILRSSVESLLSLRGNKVATSSSG